MNLYLLTQDENCGYDTYDSVIVAAETMKEARLISPDVYHSWHEKYSYWATKPEHVTITFIGTAKEGTASGVILASFNAG